MKKWTPFIFLVAVAGLSIGMILSAKGNSKNQEPEVKSEQTQLPSTPSSTSNQNSNTMTLPKPELAIDKSRSYNATLKTSEGDIVIDLFANKTPITVNNFVYLSEKGFYNNTIFHRAISGFMIQGGDPRGDGTGGPGYKFDDESFSGKYKRGTVAMANAGPDTNGSQFFIMHQDYNLPPNYVIFGQVTKGLDVVDKIATAEVVSSPTGEVSKPANPVTVNSVIIEAK